ncbi:MAG: fumarate hydratase [Gemmatimonadota bacterium]
MRNIPFADVAIRVAAAIEQVNFDTSAPVMNRLVQILETEASPGGHLAMADIVENREIAAAERVPMCQDTGMVVVFAELGEDARVSDGSLRDAVTEGVRQAGRHGHLRNSVVREPLFERLNTGDNTPPIIHLDLVPGDGLRLRLIAKGFGAENMSWARVLTPGEGVEGVKREVVRCVEAAGPNACPPVVVGLGLGGTLEVAALLAKRALVREMGSRNPDTRYAALEDEILRLVNATGIGPQGWGGANTAMDVRIEYAPTHIAGLPIAVNLDCHLQRHTEIVF